MNTLRSLFILMLAGILPHCTTFERDNPFDPGAVNYDEELETGANDRPHDLPELRPLHPAPDAGDIGLNPTLRWELGDFGPDEPAEYRIFIGKILPANPIGTRLNETSFTIANPLEENTAYEWRVVAIWGDETIRGDTWIFTTREHRLPDVSLHTPMPTNDAFLPNGDNVIFSWEAEYPQEVFTDVRYILKFGIKNPPDNVLKTGLPEPIFSHAQVLPRGTYFWQVIINDIPTDNTHAGPVWSFTVEGNLVP